MSAVQPQSCPRCGKTLQPTRAVANPDYPREFQIIFECKNCGVSLIKAATPAEVFAAAAR